MSMMLRIHDVELSGLEGAETVRNHGGEGGEGGGERELALEDTTVEFWTQQLEIAADLRAAVCV